MRQDQYGLARLQKSTVFGDTNAWTLAAQSNPNRIGLFINPINITSNIYYYTAGPPITNPLAGQLEYIDTNTVDRNYAIDGPLVCYDWYVLCTTGSADIVVIEYIADIDPCAQQQMLQNPTDTTGSAINNALISLEQSSSSLINLSNLIEVTPSVQ